MADAIEACESQRCVCKLRRNWRRKREESCTQLHDDSRQVRGTFDARAKRTVIVACGGVLSIIEAQLEQIDLRLLAA